MRSTRATAAVARLNERSKDHVYVMTSTGDGLFFLSEQRAGALTACSDALPLDDFVKLVDSLGPRKVRRMTKNDVAFEKQLVKKPAE